MAQLHEIAATKMKDMNANDADAAVRMLAGSAPLDGPHRGGGLIPMAHDKRLKAGYAAFDRAKTYALDEAVKLAKTNANAKFDETIELSMNLGIDPRHADQMVRGLLSLPNGTGKTLRVAVFARGAKAEEAHVSRRRHRGCRGPGGEGAGRASSPSTAASPPPDMMALVGRLGKILGPRGLMPNPKLGTVTMDVRGAVTAAKSGQVEFRAEKAGIVHARHRQGVVRRGQAAWQHPCLRGRDPEGQADRRQGHLP